MLDIGKILTWWNFNKRRKGPRHLRLNSDFNAPVMKNVIVTEVCYDPPQPELRMTRPGTHTTPGEYELEIFLRAAV